MLAPLDVNAPLAIAPLALLYSPALLYPFQAHPLYPVKQPAPHLTRLRLTSILHPVPLCTSARCIINCLPLEETLGSCVKNKTWSWAAWAIMQCRWGPSKTLPAPAPPPGHPVPPPPPPQAPAAAAELALPRRCGRGCTDLGMTVQPRCRAHSSSTCAGVTPAAAAKACMAGSRSSSPQPRLAYATTAMPCCRQNARSLRCWHRGWHSI